MIRRLFFYVVLMSWLFAFLDWKSVHVTRWTHPHWKEWMHTHERRYANITRSVEPVLCTPCMALKPVFYHAMFSVEASKEEQEHITHAPLPNREGFYHLVDRQTSWTFIPWAAWFLYWLAPSLVWLKLTRRFFRNENKRQWTRPA